MTHPVGHRSLRAAASVGLAATLASCRQPERPEPPPVTVAYPDASLPVMSTSVASGVDAGARAAPISATFVDLPGKVEGAACARVLVAVASGSLRNGGESLGRGDVLMLANPGSAELDGEGLAVVARWDGAGRGRDCGVPSEPARAVIRATNAEELRWASGAMSAHLDVGAKVSPELYLGRLAGRGAVAEHVHPASWEILAAVDAAGTFVVDGVEGRLGPRQVVVVPPRARHEWRPDPGSNLVAVQMYSPPGPEQRFVGLAASERDAGTPARRDAGALSDAGR